MTDTEEKIAQQLSELEQQQDTQRKKQRLLEELEADYQRLSTDQEEFLLDIIYSSHGRTQQFVLNLEDEFLQLHRANLLTIDTNREELQQELQLFAAKEDELINVRRQLYSEEKKEGDDGT
ncbi:hypothetical protein ACYSNR_03780 [Enterococcus sp. LJL128]